MTERRSGIALGGLVLLVLALAASTVYFGRDEYLQLAREHGETIGAQKAPDEKAEQGRLRIPETERRAGGIEMAALQAADAEAGVEVSGTIVDLRTLLEARARYATQSAEIRGLRAAAHSAEAEAKRAAALFQDDRNVSERVMLQTQADAKAARERLAMAEAALRGQQEGLRAEWGGTLAEMAVNASSAGFTALARGDEVLAQVTVPFELDARIAARRLLLSPAGGEARVRAQYVSAAPTAGRTGAVGASHFYRVAAGPFRVGARVTGQLSSGEGKAGGVIVPERAVVWFAGRPWVYVRDEKDRDAFERTAVVADRLLPGGWFNATGLEAGQEVVVTGAQLLLSEELEFQIRNENED